VRPLSLVAAGLYGERFLAAIDAAMAVEPERRPQDHQQFRALMGDIDSPEPLELAPPRDLMHEPFVGDDGEREITVPDHPLLAHRRPAAKPAAAKAGRRQAGAGERRAAARPAARARRRSRRRSRRRGSPPARSKAVRQARVYGLVAGTCALIGIAALALQF
jgi:hypothetical protein